MQFVTAVIRDLSQVPFTGSGVALVVLGVAFALFVGRHLMFRNADLPSDPPAIMPRSTRTLALLLCVWLWALMGLGIYLGASQPARTDYIHAHLPIGVRVAEWVVPALAVAVTTATGRGARLTIPLLVIGPLIRIVSYLWSWLTWILTGGAEGVAGAWYYALLHTPLLFLVFLTAALTGTGRRNGKREGRP